MKKAIKEFMNSSEKSKKTQKISKKEKETLRFLLLNRIVELKKCKRNMITESNSLINQISNLLTESLKRLNMFIDGWNKLLIKTEYKESELLRIKQINNIKLIANDFSHFLNLKEIKEAYQQDPFIVRPVTKINLDERFKDFQKFNMSKLTVILAPKHKSFIVTGGLDGVIRIWDKGGDTQDILYGEQSKITSLTLSADEQYLVSGSQCGIVVLFNLNSMKAVTGYACHSTKVKQVNITANNQFIVSACTQLLHITDIHNGSICGVFHVSSHPATIMQSKNEEYFMFHSTFVYVMKFSGNCIEKENCGRIEDDDCLSKTFTANGKYLVYVTDYEENIWVFRNAARIKDGMRKGNQVIGVKCRRSYLDKRLNLKDRVFVEQVLISDDFKYFASFFKDSVFI